MPPRRSFLALRDRPGVIHRLRAFAGAAVTGLPYAVDEIELIAVELVTNALRHAARKLTLTEDLWPIGVEMTADHRYVHLAVSDPDPQPMPAGDTGGLLAEHGRGLAIVDDLAVARWATYTRHGKTVHVIVAGSGVTLTPGELESIRELQ
ncbi:ATP-binding protein [Actinoallomurus spadix]|uniref:ATP-binding protein n=1 Tax=Actinoallomurus spadix TaxID=79912 RepID=UPI002092FBB6|nr:ATP-binding protein [Actinoallomurus spadix]MCO5986637.1 ATP-binding protein [Actinoallomurus spadix]